MDLLSKLKLLAAPAPAPNLPKPSTDLLLPAPPQQLALPAPKAPRALLSEQLSVPGLGAATDTEMCRILRLDNSLPPSPAEIEELSRRFITAEYFDGPEKFRLLPPQAWAIRDYERIGALGHIPVGRGKTLLSLIIAQIAFTQKGKERIVLFVPAHVRPQLVFADIPHARRRTNITTPIVDLGDLTPNQRKRRAERERGLFIMPYSVLSGRDGAELLDAIDPQVIIADEAHSIRARSTARTKRFLKWVNGRDIQFVPLSGTLTSKSLRDYHHLAVLALGEGVPLPIHAMAAREWADVLDSEAAPNEYQLRLLKPLRDWAVGHGAKDHGPTVEGCRLAFESRFNSAPGVIKDSSEIGTSLTIINTPIHPPDDYPGLKQMRELMAQVEKLWLTPNGDEIDHGMLKWKWVEELSAGFYHRLAWPAGLDPAVEQRARSHHDLEQTYHRMLRAWLKDNHATGMDTPFLVGQDMVRHGADHVGEKLFSAWKRMKEAAWPGMPERESTPIRVCDYKVVAATNWVHSFSPSDLDEGGAIVWYHNFAVGQWLVEMLQQGPHAGRLVWAPSKGERAGIDEMLANRDAMKGKVVVASIKAHGTGKNLQFLQNMLVVQFPRDASADEQLIGRLHRTGQQADHLDIHLMRSNWHDDVNFAAALNDSFYQQQTLGVPRKLIYATHDPLPRIYSDSFLRAQGLEPNMLNSSLRDRAQERFGRFTDLNPGGTAS